MAKFSPKAVFVYGPDLEANSYLSYMDNQSYIGYIYIGVEEPITVIPTAVDCSTDGIWPNIFVGSKKGQARFYDESWGVGDYNTPILSENRLVTANLELWAMNGDQLAGCEPISTMTYTPTYTQHWDSHQAFCAVESNDYRLVRDNFHPADHKSYIDFYRLHDGAEENFVTGLRSLTYTPMSIPALVTQFNAHRGWYSFTARSQHVLQAGETAYFEWQWSKNYDFSGASTTTISATLVQHWVENPPPAHYYYDYHESVLSGWFDDHDGNVPTWFRVRRVDKIDGTVTDTSDWSSILGPWCVHPGFRTDRTIYNDVPQMRPYYVYQHYDAAASYNLWTAAVVGSSIDQAQEPDIARLQVASDADFNTILYDQTGTLVFEDDGEINWYTNITDLPVSVPRGSVYYTRCRYESSDGETVGPWSVVLALDGDTGDTWQSNCYGGSYSYVVEENYTGDLVQWNIASEPLYDNGHTYVLVCKRRTHYEGSARTWFGSLYLADYDGSAVTTTSIVDAVEDWHPIGWPTHYDIVAFNGKLYAGWSDPADPDTNIYDWCEITGGVVGTVHHVARPAEAPRYSNWATMAVIHGDLRVVTSLDTDPGGE